MKTHLSRIVFVYVWNTKCFDFFKSMFRISHFGYRFGYLKKLFAYSFVTTLRFYTAYGRMGIPWDYRLYESWWCCRTLIDVFSEVGYKSLYSSSESHVRPIASRYCQVTSLSKPSQFLGRIDDLKINSIYYRSEVSLSKQLKDTVKTQ